MPTPTIGGAHSPEVIVPKRFAMRSCFFFAFLAFPPWEVVARFWPFFSCVFLASFLSPLLLLLLPPLLARFLPFLAAGFFFCAFLLRMLPLLLPMMLLLPLVLLLLLLLLLLPLPLSLSLSRWLVPVLLRKIASRPIGVGVSVVRMYWPGVFCLGNEWRNSWC